jgi:hypothetical protein
MRVLRNLIGEIPYGKLHAVVTRVLLYPLMKKEHEYFAIIHPPTISQKLKSSKGRDKP